MSGSARKQRQKKSNEKIIPIQIEGMDSKIDNTVEPTDSSSSSSKAVTTTTSSKAITTTVSSKPVTTTESSKPITTTVSSKAVTTTVSSNAITTTISSKEVTSSPASDFDKLEISENVEQNVEKDDAPIKMPARALPPYNVPEKIFIVLDRAEDELSTHFEVNNGNKVKPLDMLKDSLKFFLNTKSAMDKRHKFALITLNENSASWTHDFTSNTRSIIQKLDEIEECETEDIFDLTTVFDLINKNVKVPTPKDDLLIPPAFVVRVIFLYNRSITMPQIEMTDEISKLLASSYFTFDVTMTHETPDSSNKCNLIFRELQQLDTKGYAYFFPVSRSATLLYTAMAKLLAHPLQRCTQKEANYKLS